MAGRCACAKLIMSKTEIRVIDLNEAAHAGTPFDFEAGTIEKNAGGPDGQAKYITGGAIL